jgi:hypothetical protein
MDTLKRIAAAFLGAVGAVAIALLAGCGDDSSRTPGPSATVSTEVSTAPVTSPTSVPTSAPGS